MTDPIIYIAVVLAAIVALAALGLWMFIQMFDTDEQPEPPVEPPRPKEWTSDYVRDNIHKLKPPPEPEH